jgi:hypothetical protein
MEVCQYSAREILRHRRSEAMDDEQLERVPEDWVEVQCPYCFETVGIYLDPAEAGELVQDCEVCCNPWQLTVERDRDGDPVVRVEALG